MNLKLAKSTAESIAKEIKGEIIKEEPPEESILKSDYRFEIEMHTEINHILLDNILVHLQNKKYINIDDRRWEKRIEDSGSRYSILVDTRDRVFDILISPHYRSSTVINLRMSKIPSDEDLFAGNWL